MSEEVTGKVGDHELHVEFVTEKDKAAERSAATKTAIMRGFWWLAKFVLGSAIGGAIGWWVLAPIADWPHPIMGGLPLAIMGVALAFAGRDLRPREGDWAWNIDWPWVFNNLAAIGIGVLITLLLASVGVHPIAAALWGLPIMVIALFIAVVRDLGGEWIKNEEILVFIPDKGLIQKVPLGICWGIIIGGLLGLLLSSLWLEAGAVAGLVAFRAAMPRMLPNLETRWRIAANVLVFIATLAVVTTEGGVIAFTLLLAGIAIGAIVGLTRAKS